jgi:hypothetical protein
MIDREKLTFERQQALIEILVEQGVLSREWADALESTSELNEGAELVKCCQNGEGPPDRGKSNDSSEQ